MRRFLLGGLAVLALAAPARAQWLRVSSADVAEPGDIAEVCVSLEALGKTVAATQNDLIWDGTCATLESAERCAIAPGLDQQLFGRIRGDVDFGYRSLVLSLTEISPIPDGTLYCCPFRVEAMPHSCCAVSIGGVALSDQFGNQLGVASRPACATLRRGVRRDSPRHLHRNAHADALASTGAVSDNDCGTAPDSAGNATADSSGGCQTTVVHRMADAADPCPVPVERRRA
jgi:hypothetical protein